MTMMMHRDEHIKTGKLSFYVTSSVLLYEENKSKIKISFNIKMYVNLLSTRVMGKVRATVKGGVDPNYLTALFAVVDSPRFYPTCYPF